MFADFMAFPRQPKRARIWGTGNPGQLVTVHVGEQSEFGTTEATIDGRGQFIVELPPLPATEGVDVRVVGDSTVVNLRDVVFGDIWMCIGQSNMVTATMHDLNYDILKSSAFRYDHVRLNKLLSNLAGTPQWSPPSTWRKSGSSAIKFFSSVCYTFGIHLSDHLAGAVPIGLIQAAVSGKRIELFSSPDANTDTTCGGTQEMVTRPQYQGSSRAGNPSDVWNGMIHPYLNMDITGILFYQGEANYQNPSGYTCEFPALIADYRAKFGIPSMSFLFVQLAALHFPDFTDFREAQMSGMLLPKVTYATAIDLGDPLSPIRPIHPRRKFEIGRRLAVAAMHIEYGAPEPGVGPEAVLAGRDPSGTLYVLYEPGTTHNLHRHGTADCSLTGGGQCCRLSPFEAQVDGNWVRIQDWEIAGEAAVRLGAHADATAVRYAWDGFPQCALYSGRDGPDDHRAIAGRPFRMDIGILPPTTTTTTRTTLTTTRTSTTRTRTTATSSTTTSITTTSITTTSTTSSTTTTSTTTTSTTTTSTTTTSTTTSSTTTSSTTTATGTTTNTTSSTTTSTATTVTSSSTWTTATETATDTSVSATTVTATITSTSTSFTSTRTSATSWTTTATTGSATQTTTTVTGTMTQTTATTFTLTITTTGTPTSTTGTPTSTTATATETSATTVTATETTTSTPTTSTATTGTYTHTTVTTSSSQTTTSSSATTTTTDSSTTSHTATTVSTTATSATSTTSRTLTSRTTTSSLTATATTPTTESATVTESTTTGTGTSATATTLSTSATTASNTTATTTTATTTSYSEALAIAVAEGKIEMAVTNPESFASDGDVQTAVTRAIADMVNVHVSSVSTTLTLVEGPLGSSSGNVRRLQQDGTAQDPDTEAFVRVDYRIAVNITGNPDSDADAAVASATAVAEGIRAKLMSVEPEEVGRVLSAAVAGAAAGDDVYDITGVGLPEPALSVVPLASSTTTSDEPLPVPPLSAGGSDTGTVAGAQATVGIIFITTAVVLLLIGSCVLCYICFHGRESRGNGMADAERASNPALFLSGILKAVGILHSRPQSDMNEFVDDIAGIQDVRVPGPFRPMPPVSMPAVMQPSATRAARANNPDDSAYIQDVRGPDRVRPRSPADTARSLQSSTADMLFVSL